VAVGDDRRVHLDDLAEDTLDGISPAVDLRGHVGDAHARGDLCVSWRSIGHDPSDMPATTDFQSVETQPIDLRALTLR
jgi:hypothetical protein